ncbi:cation-translocating P-type ATPase [Parvularcula oceani]|uniref:cation-translocating P-type ATPase n=1 Tax=Parvularcula oceani TaxID=1247963 RepID=UPI00068A9326|nr:HAD-IC family P-type ATPase [Parvularcula oceani]
MDARQTPHERENAFLAGEAAGPERAWHALSAEDALAELKSRETGLTATEAAERAKRFGPNALPAPPATPAWRRFAAQFRNALIYFLLAAAGAAFVLDHVVDAVVILFVVLVNAVVGFVQEGRAEKALAGMDELVSPEAICLRGEERHAVPVADLVPGDIVIIEAGDRVPADLRLIKARGLAIEEAALTGEAVAAEKDAAPVPAEAALADRTALAYSGTLVTRGRGTGVVVATGTATEIGKISGMLRSVPRLVTPLLRQIDRFGRWLTLIIGLFGAALFAFAVHLRGFGWVEALIAVVAVAVGAIPEGLPAVITITLAIGVQRMAARNAVIRRLPAVETLGATSVICTDKTGTLTRNEMTVARLLTGEEEVPVSGGGYAPEGALGIPEGGEARARTERLVRCGLLCNDARLKEEDGLWSVIGDPMEGALLALGAKAGLPEAARDWPRLDEIPFDAAYRYMATLHRSPEGVPTAFIKGAPEAVLSLCANADMGPWQDGMARAAERGERLLAFAMTELPPGTAHLTPEALSGATMLGLMGFVDPPREEARTAIAEARAAGIAVKMITGDHAATATAIARQLDLADAPEALTGTQIEAMDDDALKEAVLRVSVFARAAPEHKLRIVRALQSHRLVVAMTGDGVNDAPSLKQADVGTAMGRSGTEAAREAAEMVLLDDNFASIVAAVREGRTVYENIRKVIAWTLPTNGGEAITIILAILLGFTLPMTATQILWVNLVTAVTLGLALAFEPAEGSAMTRPPRKRDAPLLSGFLLWRVGLVASLFTGAVLLVFFLALDRGRDVAAARTLAVNMLVVAEIFYLFNVRFLSGGSLSWRGVVGTPAVLIAVGAVIAAQLAFTYFPPLQAVFDTRPVGLAEGAAIIGIGAVLFTVLELEKALFRRFRIPGA